MGKKIIGLITVITIFINYFAILPYNSKAALAVAIISALLLIYLIIKEERAIIKMAYIIITIFSILVCLTHSYIQPTNVDPGAVPKCSIARDCTKNEDDSYTCFYDDEQGTEIEIKCRFNK